ncbi:SCP-like extracellular [Tsuneonella suprasediminis]|uniref:SCP-like extracellular n=1 Tax=Tsuneonella suprasediminis TaxID=2306996 RepID=A0A419QZ56_9SPHN|nr:CAP domain-containing protein [Tsuneonella suprasediminis]RJX66270.1 SCP-like extracellular [Tsuneonella suprasediminis]
MRNGRVATVIAGTAAFAATAAIAVLPQVAHSQGAVNAFAARLLASHNAERERIGRAPLNWSQKLAGEAQVWARQLARDGRMYHASPQQRGGAGENLWMGYAGYYSPETMIGAFNAERAQFRPGKFPNVSRTGNWADVAHYTQVVWPGTHEVGCAVARGGQNDFLVCRYWPAGNTWGERVE